MTDQRYPIEALPPPSAQAAVRYSLEPSFGDHALRTALFAYLPAVVLWGLAAQKVGPLGSDPIQKSHLFGLLFGHWVCPLILWSFAAALSYLSAKHRLLRRQQRANELLRSQVVPHVLEHHLPGESPAELFHQLERELAEIIPSAASGNLLLERCRAYLVSPAPTARPARPDATSANEELAERTRSLMQASFALPRYVVWAIPMWGLIGTVLGISEAVARFSLAIGGAESAHGLTDQLATRLTEVTGGLSSAFDATFLALLLSLPVMLLVTWLEKEEEHHLLAMEVTFAEEIAPQLPTAPVSSGGPAMVYAPADVRPVAAVPTPPLSEELRTLTLQVRALQQTIADLHESSAAARLAQPLA